MGRCEYVDESASFVDGWHCVRIGGHVDDRDIVRYYCTSSVSCKYCPYRGGDDRLRRKPEPEPAPQEEDWGYDGGGGGSSGGGGSGGGSSGGGGGGGFFSALFFEGFSFLKLAVAAICVVLVLAFGGNLLGLWGPWVDMQLPEGARVKGVELYSVSQYADSLFESRSGSFDKEGFAHARFRVGFNDVYFQQDDGSVWLGTCDLYSLNTAVVYDITYEEICQQLYRPLLVELTDHAGNPIPSLTVTDSDGKTYRCVEMGAGRYMVLLPDTALTPTLTFRAEGYAGYTAQVDMSGRLAQVVVTLAAEGGSAE